MSVYSLYQVDAFTTQPLGGNPCAVIFDCADIQTVKVGGAAITVLRGELMM